MDCQHCQRGQEKAEDSLGGDDCTQHLYGGNAENGRETHGVGAEDQLAGTVHNLAEAQGDQYHVDALNTVLIEAGDDTHLQQCAEEEHDDHGQSQGDPEGQPQGLIEGNADERCQGDHFALGQVHNTGRPENDAIA